MGADLTNVGKLKSVRQVELELRKTRLEAEAARLEARATELLMWLEVAGSHALDSEPTPVPAHPLVETFEQASPWRARELAAWERLARSGWCRDLLELGLPNQRVAAESATAHPFDELVAVGATDSPQHARPLADEAAVADLNEQAPEESYRAEEFETSFLKTLQFTAQPTTALKHVPALELNTTAPQGSGRRSVKEISVSLLLHVIAIMLLAFMKFASQEPRDVLALSAASSTASESQALETVQIETSQAPSMTTSEPSAQVAVDPLGELPSLPVNLNVESSQPTLEPLNDLLMPSSPASKSSQSALKTMKADSSTIFCGVSTGGNRLCFLVDSSKSMGEGRFEAARSELLRTIDQLSADKRFYVIFFDVNPAPMCLNSPVPEQYLAMATAENKRAVRTWAMTIGLERGEAPDDSLKQALGLEPEVIFLLTDGEFPDRTEKLLKEINRRESLFGEGGRRCIVHTIAFHGKEGIDRLTRIAKTHGGTFRYVPKP